MTSFGGFETCEFEEFVSEATPQSSTLEEAASAQEILIQQVEGYLQRFKAAICTDLTTIETQIPVPLDEFTELIDTPGTYVGAGLFAVRVNVLETGLEFAPFPVVQGADHGLLLGLADDDHLQYLLLAGRAGGQAAFGGTAATEALALRGSTDADLGFLDVFSPIRMDVDWTVTTTVNLIEWATIIPSSGGAVAAFIRVNPEISIDNGIFIFSTVFDTGRYLQTVSPGFAVHTLFFGQPNLETMTAAVQPNQIFVYAAQPQMENNGAGGLGTPIPNVIGMTYTPILITRVIGDTLSVTNMTGIQVSPSYSTIGFTSVNFGTIRGVHCVQPVQGLFQPGGGVETMTAYIGLEFNAMTFAGNVTKSVVRSFLNDATNARLIDNLGSAQSDFGLGDVHLDDNTALKLGGSVAVADILFFWNTSTSALRWSTFFGTGGAPLDLVGSAADEWVFQDGGVDIGIGFNVNAIVFGGTAPTPNSNNWFVQFAGANLRQVQVGGEYSDVLWTAGGSIDVNGLAVSDLQAFKINSPSVLLNGGSIADMSNLFVDAMPSFGGTRLQALRVLGRTRGDGLQCHNEASLAQLTADVAQLTLPANNLGRFVLLQDADANGPWTIQGILNVQVGDMLHLVNDGADAWLLGHEDGAAAAADRIISPTGVDLTLGPDESALLWYDPVATRWRIMETTGA
jgi:hypothetical protein